MRARLEQRLQVLKSEFENGQRVLVELEQKRANLEQTMLRISGAIQVLEELLGAAPPAPDKVAQQSGQIEETSAQSCTAQPHAMQKIPGPRHALEL